MHYEDISAKPGMSTVPVWEDMSFYQSVLEPDGYFIRHIDFMFDPVFAIIQDSP